MRNRAKWPALFLIIGALVLVAGGRKLPVQLTAVAAQEPPCLVDDQGVHVPLLVQFKFTNISAGPVIMLKPQLSRVQWALGRNESELSTLTFFRTGFMDIVYSKEAERGEMPKLHFNKVGQTPDDRFVVLAPNESQNQDFPVMLPVSARYAEKIPPGEYYFAVKIENWPWSSSDYEQVKNLWRKSGTLYADAVWSKAGRIRIDLPNDVRTACDIASKKEGSL